VPAAEQTEWLFADSSLATRIQTKRTRVYKNKLQKLQVAKVMSRFI